MQLNFMFFGKQSMKAFASFDLTKDPTIEENFKRFTSHLKNPAVSEF
jgi:hypothetical protein